ncbi:hypothetical protein B0T20DRAFT_49061 [Sordaria brevicollis]|uniref:Uncharacterized protein n=1 Tax=Sordaria brevicollis TaxID=83679 RepID=A0AAE0PA12_SORBR|nr:hypothetical protein B0T20DRAFT_49061 [Sordaria brevicollis]
MLSRKHLSCSLRAAEIGYNKTMELLHENPDNGRDHAIATCQWLQHLFEVQTLLGEVHIAEEVMEEIARRFTTEPLGLTFDQLGEVHIAQEVMEEVVQRHTALLGPDSRITEMTTETLEVARENVKKREDGLQKAKEVAAEYEQWIRKWE